jgi:predicted Zn-dependent protease
MPAEEMNLEKIKSCPEAMEHELGHALGLDDHVSSSDGFDGNGYRFTQMGYGRDRNTFLYLSNSDIKGVNDIW